MGRGGVVGVGRVHSMNGVRARGVCGVLSVGLDVDGQ